MEDIEVEVDDYLIAIVLRALIEISFMSDPKEMRETAIAAIEVLCETEEDEDDNE